MKSIFLFSFFAIMSATAFGQFNLTVDDLKSWTPNGPNADDGLIATVPLAEKFINLDTQFNPSLSNNAEIAYLPDGMTNFASYSEEQPVFNLYNFTNWAYIDKLVWFGGTSVETVQVPSSPWVNAAHKNGVKAIANIFFAPNQFGGSTATMLNFLEKNDEDEFVSIPPMIAMMEYYNFDGWFINEETTTNSSTALLMYEFLRDLTTQVEALGKEVMWYDAMLLSGSVNWQNRLNANNSPFVQNDEDNDSSNGFETRVSSDIFINFFWAGTTRPTQSKQRAQTIDRSEFDVFTGVDLWPGRNQGDFETSGNAWMSWIHENQTTARTSLGLFAPSAVFNNPQYSNYNNDPDDYVNFYSAERHMFAGADRNPALVDASGFRGYANWLPASSTITTIPFETNFNTGHGFSKFEEGTETSTDDWHNMNDQDILPNWQFAFSNDDLSARWDFFDAFNGGSSLEITGNLEANSPVDLTLYKTKLLLTEESKIDLVFKKETQDNSEISYVLTFESDPDGEVVIQTTSPENTNWTGESLLLGSFAGETLAKIAIRFETGQAINDYVVNIGNIRVHDDAALSVAQNSILDHNILISYPNENVIAIHTGTLRPSDLDYTIFSLSGQAITNFKKTVGDDVITIETREFARGVYLITFETAEGENSTKKIIVR